MDGWNTDVDAGRTGHSPGKRSWQAQGLRRQSRWVGGGMHSHATIQPGVHLHTSRYQRHEL